MTDKTRDNRTDDVERTDLDSNPDAITGAPGSHPVGTGIGAAAAGAAGAAIGSVVPGVGTVVGGAVGAVVGAVAGGLAGKGVAEAINPTAEEEYWRGEYRNRPYYTPGTDYDRDYAPAYRAGYTAAGAEEYRGRDWNDVEQDLSNNWESARGQSSLTWDKARNATRDAWDRVTNRTTVTGGTGSDTLRSGTSNYGTAGATAATSSTMGATTSAGGFNDPDVDTFARTCQTRYSGRNFDDVESDLRRDWDRDKSHGSRTWDNVKDSVRSAWHKVERAMPGDADRDGR